MSEFFRTENVTKTFGGLTAVDKVSFDMNTDEILGLIGPNGAGKTTLFNLITGIIEQDSGEIFFKEDNITDMNPDEIANKGISRTFQVVRPFHQLPVIANVMVAAFSSRGRRRGDWIKMAEKRARDSLEFVGIADHALESATELSHGNLKRLELARAIVTEPELLLLDEPFGGLNPAETDLLVKSIQRLHKGGRFGRLHSEGPAIIAVEHKLSDLMRLVDRVIVLHFGEVIAEGEPEEIVNNEEVREAYLGDEEVSLDAFGS